MSEELMTQEELAKKRKCSSRTLERERVAGTGCPYVKIGGRIYYRAEDWRDFVLSRRRLSTSEAA